MTTLTKNQTKSYGPRTITHNGQRIQVRATVRYDDRCGNGHNTFSITGEYRDPSEPWSQGCGGCIHDEIAAAFPELAPLIKWHLVSSDGPMHYLANTLYHAKECGPQGAWIAYEGASDPLGIFEGQRSKLSRYTLKPEPALLAEGKPGYTVKWDEKTSKVADLDAARSCAIWPEATIEQLRNKAALEARLPALMAEFRDAVESLGFVY